MRLTRVLSWRRLLVLALFCFVLGAKFLQIERYGSDLPFWDQWDAEGDLLYRPYIEGHLTGSALIAAHNEHRILFSRLLALGLFEANDRQWDARVEMLANAVIHGLVAVLLAAFALRILPRWPALASVAAIALFFSTAVDWENTLGAFQSPFYFLLLFSALHLSGTLLARPGSWAWRLAPLAGAAALFTMASGALSALAIVATIGLRALRDRKLTRGDLWVLAINAVLFLAGWLLQVHATPAYLLAPNFRAGCIAWLYQLAWPVKTPWAAPLGLLPPLVLALAYLRRRVDGAPTLTLLGGCGWFWMQAAAIAYARSAGSDGYASRYTDILIAGVLLSLLALATLATSSSRASARRCWSVLTLLATGIILLGLFREDSAARQAVFPGLPSINAVRINAVRRYVAVRDPVFFSPERAAELPYPSAVRLAQLLDLPVLRSTLPISVRPPVNLAGESSSTRNFRVTAAAVGPGPAPLGLQAWKAAWTRGGSPAPAYFLSKPFAIDHRRLSLFVAGTTAKEDFRLRLIDDQGRVHEPLDTGLSPSPRWKQVNFIVPKGRGQLEVAATGGWFAFTQPITNTELSNFALRADQSGPWWIGLGLILYLVAVGASWPGKEPPSRSDPLSHD